MRLSVCLIARNEEQNLPRVLTSVAGVADEVIVTDTGSTDTTPDIASQFGAHLHHFPWCDDFSAARNHAVDQAQGRWVLWLDADEELLPGSREELLQCLESEDTLAYMVVRQDLVRADQPDLYTQMWQLRLFRRDPDLRFRGHCHPNFYPAIEEIAKDKGMDVKPSTITLRHYGYVGELRPAKQQRALHLLAMELEERPGQLYYLVEYGRTLLAVGDARGHEVLAEAAQQIIPHLDEPNTTMPLVAALLEYLLQVPDDHLPPGLTRDILRDVSRRWFPRGAPLLWIMAKQDFDAGTFEQAEKDLRSLVQMGKDRSYDQYISFVPAIIGEDAQLNLAVCLLRQGKLDEAERRFESLLSSKARGTEARKNLKAAQQLRRQFGIPGRRSKHKS